MVVLATSGAPCLSSQVCHSRFFRNGADGFARASGAALPVFYAREAWKRVDRTAGLAGIGGAQDLVAADTLRCAVAVVYSFVERVRRTVSPLRLQGQRLSPDSMKGCSIR